MSEQKPEQKNDQRDKGEAARTRPKPSQAEGDRDTIDQDLKDKDLDDPSASG